MTAGNCIGCNKPSEVTVTTYLLDLEKRTWQEVGVDVKAEWDGEQVRVVSEPPHMGYSGMIFSEWEDDHKVGVTQLPLSLNVQAGATDSVHFRIYRADAEAGAPPLRIIPAGNTQDTYSTWGFWWGDAPTGLLKIELWAEVRPSVPDDPKFRREDGKRWAVVYDQVVRVKEGARPAHNLSLHRVQMTGAQSGWGVGNQRRILRTADGGATWRDVSPPGLDRCAGRLFPHQIDSFDGNRAAIGLSCDSTGPDGKRSPLSGRVSLFLTADAGRTWQESAIDSGYSQAKPVALTFADDRHGWALIQPVLPYPDWSMKTGTLYRTTDGGASWQKVSQTGAGMPVSQNALFVTPERGWLLGKTLEVTKDGGQTWTASYPNTAQ